MRLTALDLRFPSAWLVAATFLIGCVDAKRAAETRALMPPDPPREFRAVWVASVKNMDWPSRLGLSTQQQQEEMVAILERAVQLKLNAIVLQVRPCADALYDSKLEPWSEYLTGKQGQPPQPFYDPLNMWVEEAHRRGLELHAWFNPFRAGADGRGEASADHLSKSRLDLVRQHGEFLWLDPGDVEVQQHTLAVFFDVVRRYDIDGVHIDDYFYPYPVEGKDFPDGPSWSNYVNAGGKLSRADWRRENINWLIRDIHTGIKRIKPHVKFGISPFGIWQPGFPASVKGFNSYEKLYADAKLWLNEGWCDYFTPQLYWKASAPEQPFRDLLLWWSNENIRGRHLWPGLYTTRIDSSDKSWEPRDIIEQIEITRQTPGVMGQVHFSMIGFLQNRKTINDALANGPYAEPALVPLSPWLDNDAPAAPQFTVSPSGERQSVNVSWKPRGKQPPRLWAVYAKHNAAWKLHVFPGGVRNADLPPDPVLGPVTAVSVSAVDRLGNQSKPALAKKR